jgi:hypothetical protein
MRSYPIRVIGEIILLLGEVPFITAYLREIGSAGF